MLRQIAIGAVALLACTAGVARAQTAGDVPAVLAVAEEQTGQAVGEAALGGSSVFVTAKGTARIDGARPYAVSAQGQAGTAAEAAAIRDAKIEKLRAVARRFSVQMTVADSNYADPGRFPPLAVNPPKPGGSDAAPAWPAGDLAAPAASAPVHRQRGRALHPPARSRDARLHGCPA